MASNDPIVSLMGDDKRRSDSTVKVLHGRWMSRELGSSVPLGKPESKPTGFNLAPRYTVIATRSLRIRIVCKSTDFP